MEEIWLAIKGYEGMYEVSNLGRIRSLPRLGSDGRKLQGRIRKPFLATGYYMIDLCKDSQYKKYLVHRLVAEAFIENPTNLPEINHKDEDPLNNCVDNLEWCDHIYNINYGHHNEKMSQSKKDKTPSESTKEKMRKAHLGKHWKLVDGKRIYY